MKQGEMIKCNLDGRMLFAQNLKDGSSLMGLPFIDSHGEMIGYLLYKADGVVTDGDLLKYGQLLASERRMSGMVADLIPMPYYPQPEGFVPSAIEQIIEANPRGMYDTDVRLPALRREAGNVVY